MQGATGMMPQAFPQAPPPPQQSPPQHAPTRSHNHPVPPGKDPSPHPAAPGLDPSQLVALLNHITDERLVEDVGCVYQFNISGGETWYLDLKNGRGQAGQGAPTVSAPDAVISLSAEDLRALVCGEVTAFNAYMQGRVTIVGDVRLAMKLQTVVDRMKQPRAVGKATHARDDVMIV